MRDLVDHQTWISEDFCIIGGRRPQLEAASNPSIPNGKSRVVNVSSFAAHFTSKINYESLDPTKKTWKGMGGGPRYVQSKFVSQSEGKQSVVRLTHIDDLGQCCILE